MIKLKGKPIFGGITKGKLQFYRRDESVIEKRKIDNPKLEKERFEYAKSCALIELVELYEKSVEKIGENDAEIFVIHQMIIKDVDFNKAVDELILDDHFNADYAVAKIGRDFTNVFNAMESDYIKQRSADLKDVCDRLIHHIQNKIQCELKVGEKSIICADDLVPSETIGLDKSKVMAFCTCYGSSNSHTAILARTMNIPAIYGVGKDLLESYDGSDAIIDGYSGILYIDPDEKTYKMLIKKEIEEAKKRDLLKRLKGRKNRTLDGKEIGLYANISGLSDLESAKDNDAGGIGLFRSEFLYLENKNYPDEELQFYYYRQVLEQMAGKKVIIRTMDIGADKKIEYFNLDSEENPAMGLRSIRLSLARPDIFKTQLRALLRASVYGKLAIMFPMIIDIEEVRRAKSIIEQVKIELDNEGKSYSEDLEVGIMIETPAAAILSDQLAPEVDFFSIGTNDLEQYTLAIDRQNPHIEKYCKNHHLAIFRLMELTCKNAHRYGKWVGLCGELGSNPDFTEIFIRMGIDEISVTPSQILPIRSKIRTLDLSK